MISKLLIKVQSPVGSMPSETARRGEGSARYAMPAPRMLTEVTLWVYQLHIVIDDGASANNRVSFRKVRRDDCRAERVGEGCGTVLHKRARSLKIGGVVVSIGRMSEDHN